MNRDVTQFLAPEDLAERWKLKPKTLANDRVQGSRDDYNSSRSVFLYATSFPALNQRHPKGGIDGHANKQLSRDRDLLAAALREEISCLRPRVWLLADDIYEHIIYDDFDFVTAAALEPRLRDCILTVNGVSKDYAMTGGASATGPGRPT